MKWVRRALIAALILVGSWLLFLRATRLEAPRVIERTGGEGRLVQKGHIWELTLRGDAAQLGERHATLARDLMAKVDVALDASFRAHVPAAAARFLLPTLVRAKYRHLPDHIPPDRLRELASEAQTYEPFDPMKSVLPTFHRLVLYHALYDIALGFERSPLLGCSVFGVSGASSRDGHLWIARNFDLEEDEFDRDKVVLRVSETGRIPYLSVAWAGMTGVVTGLSREGVWVSVNGGRAGEVRTDGIPLPFVLRAILSRAHDLDEAIEIARSMPVNVSHILFLGDGKTGRMAVVERSPDRFAVRRAGPGTFYVTNHFLTPELAADPKNQRIEKVSTTLARYQRLGELLPPHAPPLDLAGAIAVLRDKRGPGGAPLPKGDRRAIDAFIATHSVVADATARRIWVAEAPHTEGDYLEFTVPAE